VTQRNVATRGDGLCAIVERASGTGVGFCGLDHPGGQAEAEPKTALRPERWGRGYASEATTALLADGVAAHGLRRVVATIAPLHHASHRVLLKARRGELVRNDDGLSTQRLEGRAVVPLMAP
jgi:RimJ/RimL family protein N-acetyltransferase